MDQGTAPSMVVSHPLAPRLQRSAGAGCEAERG